VIRVKAQVDRMTRSSLNSTLRRLYVLLGSLLVLSLVAKFRAYIPGLDQLGLGAPLADAYEYLRDMSLLIAALSPYMCLAWSCSFFCMSAKAVMLFSRYWPIMPCMALP